MHHLRLVFFSGRKVAQSTVSVCTLQVRYTQSQALKKLLRLDTVSIQVARCRSIHFAVCVTVVKSVRLHSVGIQVARCGFTGLEYIPDCVRLDRDGLQILGHRALFGNRRYDRDSVVS